MRSQVVSAILLNCDEKYQNYLANALDLIYNFATHLAVTVCFECQNCLAKNFYIDKPMIKIPFDRCVILTTLDFDRIMDRLESAIYDQRFQYEQNTKGTPKRQLYYGQLEGFKFVATRVIGSKYLHLPGFLMPTIEGKIQQLYNGYEISLAVKLNSLTFMLLVTWLGALFTFTVSSLIDNILGEVKDFAYLTDVGISIGLYLLTIGYIYFASWRATQFFRSLFTQRLLGTTNIVTANHSSWPPVGIHRKQQILQRSSVDWLKRNLPSFPSPTDSQVSSTKAKVPSRKK